MSKMKKIREQHIIIKNQDLHNKELFFIQAKDFLVTQQIEAFKRNMAEFSEVSGLQRFHWISQYLPSLGGVRTFSYHQTFYREWISKSFPADREGLTVLKSILPCR